VEIGSGFLALTTPKDMYLWLDQNGKEIWYIHTIVESEEQSCLPASAWLVQQI
jgi:hypothetical protein